MHSFSKKDLADGRKLLEKKGALPVLFSEGTYQVEIPSDKKGEDSLWPFIQLSDTSEVLDGFCTCDLAEKKGTCPHLAAAFLRVMDGQPLHVQFRESLWNQIGKISAERHGYESDCLRNKKEGYEALDSNGKCLFSIQPKNGKGKKELESILFDRPVETEETSLKFSNLPAEELSLWREGRPSPHLRYELSFWSDLAKWWMKMQETGGPYTLEFSKEDVPGLVTVTFPNVSMAFSIDIEHWPEIIPTLAHVNSPLEVHPYLLGRLEAITFHPEEGVFTLDFAKNASLPNKKGKGIELGEWLLYPGFGFYPKETDPLLQKTRIDKEEVNLFLNTHLKLAIEHCKGEKLHTAPVPMQYKVTFIKDDTLVIDSFLFTKGDLENPGAHYFGDWAYLPGKGFSPIEEQIFKGIQLRVPKEKISDFINRNKVWLQGYEGFQSHVSGVESHLGFRFNKKGVLLFYTCLEFSEEKEHIVDVGEWIYVPSKGFYAKVAARPGAFVKAGMEVEPDQISSFIRQNSEELEPISGFFSEVCPLEKTGVNIGFNQEGRIEIHPEFFFSEGHDERNVHIYGDYTYVDGEGFALIPQTSRLPESYKKAKVIDPLAEPYFVGYELELLYPHVLTIDPNLKTPHKLELRLLALKREPKAKTGQWVLELQYETDIGTLSPYTIWKGAKEERPYLFSDAGLILLRNRRFDWLLAKGQKSWSGKGRFLRMNTLEFLRLCSLENILEPEGEGVKIRKTRELLREFLSFTPPSAIDITGLKSDLRPYQQTGVAWLWFLYSHGLSGLLCDEMGLGKTHQAMGLISGIKNASKTHKPKFLVVCPTSVIYHWENLLHKFLPEVRLYIFHGTGREFAAFSEGDYDLLLTSYGIVRTESKALSSCHFDLAIFDELQIAKNEKSLTHKALKILSSTMRLGLTGTPIENRLHELKALFDLTLPGYLPSTASFRELFSIPIEKYGDEKKKQVLSRLIDPFLLRRRKAEVLTELPEKIEEIALCDLSPLQHELYREIVQSYRSSLFTQLRDTKRSPPIVHIFSMLSKLKQVCDHPCLINKDTKNYKDYPSGKWDLFLELLSEVRDSGQKLVVFSQYLKMLDIMGMHLKSEKIEFAEIRGSTKDRREQVVRFEEDPNCAVFLGSLQAAGVGIDLISASVVIHYDRWWNPAKENQATDRVHRMGQKRGVQVFKLVTKDTIEEQIHRLIERKIGLAKGVIGFDEEDQIKGLKREELIELLRLMD
ncbi:MAG: hypothetical protein KR126chlam1_00794 [Chlamydiae bacterium]|nr:hypothetical protein [Chlamydiota bacterium]